MFPTSPAPNSQSMNYTVVVLGGWLLFSIGFYYFPVIGGVHWFKGPVANTQTVSGQGTSDIEKDSLEADCSTE